MMFKIEGKVSERKQMKGEK